MTREFTYQLPPCATAYALVNAIGDAILAMPDDPDVADIPNALNQLRAVYDNPESAGIAWHWYYLAGIYEGDRYCKGTNQWNEIQNLLGIAKKARMQSGLPTPTGGTIQTGLNNAADAATDAIGKGLPALGGILKWVVIAIAVIGAFILITRLVPARS